MTQQSIDEIIKPEEVAQAEVDPNNAGNPIAVREKTKTAVRKLKERAAVVGALMETSEGREFLGWLMFDLGNLHKPLVDASFNPSWVNFKEGARHFALALDKLCLHADPLKYMQMRIEYEGIKPNERSTG